MITPHPTTKIDPKISRGVLSGVVPETATKPAFVKIAFPNTSYELHLLIDGQITAQPERRILGTISARARRIDNVRTGGKYVEPVMGHPRRAQGTVIEVDGARNVLVVECPMPVHVTPTDPRQKATDFQPGQFVSFDLQEGVTFRQV